MKKTFLIVFLLNFSLGFSQNIKNNFIIVYRYENHTEFNYLRKIDSISDEVFGKIEKDYLAPKFQYIEDSLTSNSKNSITTNYWINSQVKFIFENDNLSYISKNNFDKYRRAFYKDKDLFILLSIDDNYKYKNNLRTIAYNNFNVGILSLDNFIAATFYDDETERFLQFYYFLLNDKVVKIIVKELNAHYNWDIVNYNEFYFKENKLIFDSFYQSLMDGRFSLEIKYDTNYLIDLSKDIYNIITNKNAA